MSKENETMEEVNAVDANETSAIETTADAEMKSEENGDATAEAAAADKKEEPKDEQETTSGKKKRKAKTAEAPVSSHFPKRARKSAQSYQPENFAETKDKVEIIEGRGTKLEDIPNVKAKLESFSNNSKELQAAHKFVFRANLGKALTKHRLENLLAFSGYLPALEEDQDEEELEKAVNKAEIKYSERAFKLKKAEIKMLCDVFDIDRMPSTIDKDELVDRLCDFLSEPKIELTNAGSTTTPTTKKKAMSTKKKTTTKKKKKEQEEGADGTEEETEDEESESEEEVEEGAMPSKKVLRKWVKAYVACFNVDNVTVKHAVATATDKFGVDMSEMKPTIKAMLTEEM